MRYQVQVERRGGGFVPGDDQGQYLVDQLLVAHRLIRVAIAGGHQHAQEVEMLLPFAAAAIDQFRDQLGQRAKAKREFQIAVLLLGDDFEGICAELPFQALEIAAEYRAQDDFQGQFAGIVAQIDRLGARRLRRPARRKLVVDAVYQGAELIDDAAVKGGLHHAPLPAPKIPFAGHDAVAQQDLDAIHALTLGVVAMIRQQHPLDVVGMVDDVVIHSSAGGEDAVDVAELGEIAAQTGQRFIVAAEIEAFDRAGGQCQGLHGPIVT